MRATTYLAIVNTSTIALSRRHAMIALAQETASYASAPTNDASTLRDGLR
jgi:hypothetical protein